MHTPSSVRLLTLLVLALCLWSQARAQVVSSKSIDYHRERGRQYLEQRLSQDLEDRLITEEAMNTMLEYYDDLVTSPLQANRISLEELLALPLMTEYKAYQFVRFRSDHGGHFSSPSQLKLIAGWQDEDVDLYYPMLVFTTPQSRRLRPRDYWEHGRTQADMIAVYPMRTPRSQEYIGSPLALSIRWHWRSYNRISIMLGADRGSYEPWRHEGHRGFDSYSGHIALRDMGALRRLVIGDYRVHWGEGLIIHQGWRMASPLSIGESPRSSVTPVSGTSSASKSRGVATELQLGAWRLSAIASYRLVDGYVNAKTRLATGISDIGLHRSAREWYGRNNIAERHAGAQIAYRLLPRLEIALSTLWHDWDGTMLANAPGASGVDDLRPMKRHGHLSLSYRYGGSQGRWALSGEIAQSSIGAWAGTQRLSYRHGRYGRATLGLRYIAPSYWSYHGRSYTHYLRPHNEAGISLGLEIPYLLPRLSMTLEGDYYHALKPRWRQTTASRGYWVRSRLRYRLAETATDDHLMLQSYYRDELSGQRLWRHHLSYTGRWGALTYSPKVSVAWHHRSQERHPLAYSLGVRLDYVPKSSSIRLRTSGSYYHVDDWDDRLFVSEARLNRWYSPTFVYGRGYRLSSVVEGRLYKRLSLGLQIVYHHRHAPHSSQVYTALQLRYH